MAAQVEKSAENIFLYLACLRAGLVYVPLNPAYTQEEISYFLTDSSPGLFVHDPKQALPPEHGLPCLSLSASGEGSLPALAGKQSVEFQAPELGPESLAALVYTSGTTGRSKGARLTHGNLLSNAEALRNAWSFTKHDALLHALPLFHVHGLFVALHTVLLSGARLELHAKFELDAVLDALPRCSVLMGVPTFYTRLLSSPRLNPELVKEVRLFVSGSAPLLAETHRAFEARTGHKILERYGMTETGMLCSNPLEGERVAGAVGKPLPGVELRIRKENQAIAAMGEIGGIEVKGPNVFAAYWQRDSAEDFTADGFFKTGDLGFLDHSGYVHLVGRSKDLIISGGYNVYPKEVESVLDEFPEVQESAVVGVPHADFGEAVVAVLCLNPGAQLSESEAISRAKEKLASYKCPKRVIFRELPRNAMGKVQKKVLRSDLAALFLPSKARH